VILRAAAIWLLLLVIAFACGTLRALVLEPALGEQPAHVVGTIAVIVLFVVAITATIRWVEPRLRTGRLLAIGIGWTAATVLFEFGFGHFVAGHSWNRLFADYNLARGRIWLLVLLTTLLNPLLAGRFRKDKPDRRTP